MTAKALESTTSILSSVDVLSLYNLILSLRAYNMLFVIDCLYYTVQFRSHWQHVAIKHLKCSHSKLRCTVSVKYILDFKDLA